MATPAELEVDLYSGQPNPRGRLTTEQTGQLLGQLAAPIVAASLPDPGLGYRGFVVHLDGGSRTLRVFRGVIRDEGSGATRLDVDRQLERRLADWAAAFVPPEMAEWLRTAD